MRALALIGRVLRALCWPACTAGPAPSTGLVSCRSCRSDMVCPLEWHELDEERWTMLLRCGECGFTREVTASNEEAAEFDAALSAHTAAIERALQELEGAQPPLA